MKKYEELSLPSEHLDETKHEKIFVLNNKNLNQSNLSEIISSINNLKNVINGKTAFEVRKNFKFNTARLRARPKVK